MRVVLHILCHGSLGLVRTLHDGVVVIVGGGQHIVAGKQEDGGKAEQRKVHAVAAGVAEHGIQTVGRSRNTQHKDGQRHIPVHRLTLQLRTLAALGSAQLGGKLRLCVQILLRPAQGGHAVLCLGRKLRQLAGGLFGGLFL